MDEEQYLVKVSYGTFELKNIFTIVHLILRLKKILNSLGRNLVQ